MHLIDTKFYVKNVLFAVKTIFAVSLTKIHVHYKKKLISKSYLWH